LFCVFIRAFSGSERGYQVWSQQPQWEALHPAGSRQEQQHPVSQERACTGRRLCLRDQELLFSDLKFDGWNFDSHKTIDNKTFCKTADICQLLICNEGEDFDDEEDANSPEKKKRILIK
jgi:hypothetical protein